MNAAGISANHIQLIENPESEYMAMAATTRIDASTALDFVCQYICAEEVYAIPLFVHLIPIPFALRFLFIFIRTSFFIALALLT